MATAACGGAEADTVGPAVCACENDGRQSKAAANRPDLDSLMLARLLPCDDIAESSCHRGRAIASARVLVYAPVRPGHRKDRVMFGHGGDGVMTTDCGLANRALAMRPARGLRIGASVLSILLLPSQAFAAEGLNGAGMSIFWILPFAALLLAIATGPLF